MKRTTISLPDDLALLLEREARRRTSSASEIAREALRAHFSLGLEAAPRPLGFIGLGGSGQTATAENFEEELARERERDYQAGSTGAD